MAETPADLSIDSTKPRSCGRIRQHFGTARLPSEIVPSEYTGNPRRRFRGEKVVSGWGVAVFSRSGRASGGEVLHRKVLTVRTLVMYSGLYEDHSLAF